MKKCLFRLLGYTIWMGLSPVWAQDNIALVGRLEYPYTSSLSNDEILNDIWGYVAPDGHEYALVGTFNGLSIVDLADPANPEEIHFVPGPESIWRDIKTFEEFAYVSNETRSGITIVDMGGLPDSIRTKSIQPEGVTTAHNLYQADGFLYIAGSNQKNGGLVIMRLGRDPWNPEFAGAYEEAYVHDVYVRSNLAYAAEIDNRRLRILSVSTPASPQVLGQRTYPGAFTHNTWLSDNGEVCFTTDELDAAYIIAWDIRDPENIEELDRIRSSRSRGAAAPHNVHVVNDFLVSSYYGDGVQVVDASRPHNLVEVGSYDTAPDVVGGLFGCWGAYPFLPSGLILATDLSNGLFVLRPSYNRAAFFEGEIVDQNTQSPILEATIRVLGENISLVESDLEGKFATGFAEAGEKTLIVEHPDYTTDTLILSFTSGEVNFQSISLSPSQQFTTLTVFPNPVQDRLTVVIPEGNVDSWQLLDVQGREIATSRLVPGEKGFTLPFLFAEGLYILKLQITSGEAQYFQVLK